MMRKNSAKGFVAIDDIEFRYIELCEFAPPNAKPVPTTVPPTTTATTKAPTTSVTTTIEPTEPPNCK